MKRNIALCIAIAMILSACASPAQSTTVPIEQVQSISTSTPQPAESTATATLTPEPTSTPTPVPPPPHWYWDVDADTENVIAANQFGEQHELGSIDQIDAWYTTSISIDNERALLFLDNDNNLRLYLLTPNGVQKIALPSDPFYFDTELSQISRVVIAVHEDHVVFSYVTEGGSNLMPDTGPLFLVDLTSLTTKLVDETVSRDTFRNNSYWFHTSQDGRYLRYLNGDRDKMEIRELDMVTGEARTLYTTSGSSFNIRTSPQGDLWYLRTENAILDLDGNKFAITDETLTVRPLKDGKVAVFPRDCVDTCEIKIITPFGNDPELTYSLPWTILSGTFFTDVSQLLPDQSLLFVGDGYLFLADTPASIETYSDLGEEDSPVFLLTPDGQASLVGIYAGGVSSSGQYILMKSIDLSSFFIYDAFAGSPLFDMPIDTSLEDYFVFSTQFFDESILVNLNPSVPGEKSVYRFFYYGYVYDTAASLTWEDVNAEIYSCPDLLEDGSVVCWFYRTDSNYFDLIRYDPATGTKTILMENAWLIEIIP